MSGFSNFSTLTVGNPYRTQRNLHLTLLSESWQLDVCCPLNTFVPVASARTPLGIMGLPRPSIHTSQARFVVMQVRFWLFHVVLSKTNPVSFSDVLVHRQLAAAINYSPLHPSLHSKSHVERVLGVVNRRHRMAQMAGRASVEFYVGLALKARGEKQVVTEEAFVIRAFRNGLGVFVSKFVFISPYTLSRILMVDSSQTGHRRTGNIQARDTV
jgi:hypothetical protein